MAALSSRSLSRDHFERFRAFGFLVFRGLFTPEETRDLERQFDRVMESGNRDALGIGRGTDAATAQLRLDLASDSRMQDIAECVLGDECQFMSVNCTAYAADTPWHAASAVVQWASRVLKIAIYLDPLDVHSGCLRVIPGSHRNSQRLLDPRWSLAPDPLFGIRNRDVVWDNPPWGLAPQEVPYMPLETQPGDVLAFPEDLLHCAFESKGPRRQISVNFLELPRTEEQIFDAKLHNAWGGGRLLRPPQDFVDSDDPSLRRMTHGLVALGFEPVAD